MINTANPDINLVHSKVAAAIAKAEGRAPEQPAETAEAAPAGDSGAAEEGTAANGAAEAADQDAASPKPAPTTPSTPPAITGGSLGSLSTGYAANQSEDLGAVC